jgi:hypothetical protein
MRGVSMHLGRFAEQHIHRQVDRQIALPFSLREKVPGGRMREWTFRLTDGFPGSDFSFPHPALRATFSRGEKGSKNAITDD